MICSNQILLEKELEHLKNAFYIKIVTLCGLLIQLWEQEKKVSTQNIIQQTSYIY